MWLELCWELSRGSSSGGAAGKAEEVPCPGTGLSQGARTGTGGTAQIPESLHSIRRQAAPRSQTGATVRGKDEPGGGRGAGWILPQTSVS